MKWTKPNGSEIETNDDKVTIEYCESLGWLCCDEDEPEVKITTNKSRKAKQ
jgi:hypothetical protein